MTHPFAPLHEFVSDVDSLMERPDGPASTVQAVKTRLARLLSERPALPEATRALEASRYARHLLYQDPRGRYEMIVMAWGPGQFTPVHDHSGIWCVEGVVEGLIDVTRYDLTSMEGDRAHLVEMDVVKAGLGQCGALIPPVEYHRIANPYDNPAYTLHVYGGCMRTCRVFTRHDDGTWQVAIRPLGYSTPNAALSPA
jgi:predicted metal-dependent enzyme (double-stranded beta helix superfamily)